MANRSYLYAMDTKPDKSIKDMSEWRTFVPISHMLLVSGDPEIVASELWNADVPIGIRGNGEKGFQRFRDFLDLLKIQLRLPDKENNLKEVEEAIAFIEREENRREFYLLEGGEVYDLTGDPLEKTTEYTHHVIGQVAADVDKLLAAQSRTIFRDCETWELKQAEKEWDRWMGLYFSDILYFHFK